jgi:hypothetical protein
MTFLLELLFTLLVTGIASWSKFMRLTTVLGVSAALATWICGPAAAQTAEKQPMTTYPPPVTFSAMLPSDTKNIVPPTPPKGPFEAAGFDVVEASWDNRPLRGSRFPWMEFSRASPGIAALRERYDFLKAIEPGRTEIEKLLLLRQWVRKQIPRGPDSPVMDPFIILERAAEGRGGVCTQYTALLESCALAAGWCATRVDINQDHLQDQPSANHTVTEVWVNELRKWVVLDAMYDSHHEKNGVILSSAEICQEWLANGGNDVINCQGPERTQVARARRNRNLLHGESGGYFWRKHVLAHDPFGGMGSVESDIQVCPIGEAHKGKTWFQGQPPDEYPVHTMLRGALIFTERSADVNPDIGTCQLTFLNEDGGGKVRIRVGTFTPAFEAVLTSVDGGDYVAVERTKDNARGFNVLWNLHEGENALKVRTRNEYGMLGYPTTMRVVLKKKGE